MSARWPEALDQYAKLVSGAVRELGIEMTQDEVRDMVLEEIKMAIRLHLRGVFLGKLT